MKRLRQSLLAAAVALLHVLVIQALILMREPAPQQTADSLTWVPIRDRVSKPAVAALESLATIRPQPPTPLNLPALVDIAPIIITPSEDSAQAAFRDLVTCSLPDNGKVWTEERERCQKITSGLRNVAVAAHVPTEKEEKLARRFKHAKAKEDAPLLLPCFNGAFFSVICLANGFAHGFDQDDE